MSEEEIRKMVEENFKVNPDRRFNIHRYCDTAKRAIPYNISTGICANEDCRNCMEFRVALSNVPKISKEEFDRQFKTDFKPNN